MAAQQSAAFRAVTGSSRLRQGAAALLLVAAFAVRVSRLDAQSLWYDEGLSIALAGRSLPTILRNAADDIHPPLYYILLAAWTHLVGPGAFASRFLSVACGTCLVALLYAIARRMWSGSVGLVACLFAGLSPYLIWYSQEARMYMLVAALGAAALWLTLDLAAVQSTPARADIRRLLALAGLETAALYSHYFVGAMVCLAVNGTKLLVQVPCVVTRRGSLPEPLPPIRRSRALRGGSTGGAALTSVTPAAWRAGWLLPWLGAQLAAFLLFVPWLWYAGSALARWPATSDPFGLHYALTETVRVLALGARRPALAVVWPIFWAAAVGLGLLSRSRRGWARASLIALGWLALPALALWLGGIARPAWEAKQLVSGTIGFEVLAAAGVIGLAHLAATWPTRPGEAQSPQAKEVRGRGALRASVAGAFGLTLLVWPRLVSLTATWHDPRLQRDDYRGIARTVEELAGPDDAVLLNAPTQIEVFEYYDRRVHQTYPVPSSRPPDRQVTERQLALIARQHRDLFGVLWATSQSDPERIVEGWLNSQRYKVFDSWFGNVRLAQWARAREPMPWADLGSGVVFGGTLRLLRLAHSPLVTRPGEILTLAARWEVLSPPPVDYVVFVQLLDAGGHLAAQRDMPPCGGSARTSLWQPSGTAARVAPPPFNSASEQHCAQPVGHYLDRIGLRLPWDLEPGRYQLIMGLYDPATARRLTIDTPAPTAAGNQDALTIGWVSIH